MKSISSIMVGVALIFTIGACARAPEYPFGPPNPNAPTAPPTQAEIANARKAVATQMIDPTSLLFSQVIFVREQKSQVPIFCGLMNAKNRLGGYNGPNPFFVIINTPFINSANFNTLGFERFKNTMAQACYVSRQIPVPNF